MTDLQFVLLALLLSVGVFRSLLSARFYYVRKHLFWRPLWRLQRRLKS